MGKRVSECLRACWVIVMLTSAIWVAPSAFAAQQYTPNDVFSGVSFANILADRILAHKNIKNIKLPKSRETDAKPMHVYELHSSILTELHKYALTHGRRPPPLAISTPIQYTPTDVFYLTELVVRNLRDIYEDDGGKIDFKAKTFSGKRPADVYQILFELYYKLNRLNGRPRVSPNEVYTHIFRAKEDLQYSLLTLSKRLGESEENRKILLVSAIYGMHPDGTLMPPREEGKRPADVLRKVFQIREKLNQLRQHSNLNAIAIPRFEEYGEVNPIDVFLQVQFVIAELNLLKIPMDITTTTNRPKPVTDKIPSDVFHEASHIEYMLDRLLKFNFIKK